VSIVGHHALFAEFKDSITLGFAVFPVILRLTDR
jgi:glucose/arabinose dehydrogenase